MIRRYLVLGKLPPSRNSNANPKPNPDPDPGAVFLGDNFPDTPYLSDMIIDCKTQREWKIQLAMSISFLLIILM